MPTYRPGLGDDGERYLRHEHGWIEYRYGPGGTCEMLTMEVMPEHRRKGIASDLLRQLEADPLVKVVYGFVLSHNMQSYRFFMANGFHSTLVHDFYGRGSDAYLVVKVL